MGSSVNPLTETVDDIDSPIRAAFPAGAVAALTR